MFKLLYLLIGRFLHNLTFGGSATKQNVTLTLMTGLSYIYKHIDVHEYIE